MKAHPYRSKRYKRRTIAQALREWITNGRPFIAIRNHKRP
jgi:hypothetical protein